MVTADFIVGIIGNIVSVSAFLAPIGQFKEIVKNKSAAKYNGSPYIASLLSCSLWTFYGALDPDDGVLVMTVNAIGVTAQVAYLALLLFYYPKAKKVKCIGFIIVDMVFLGTVMAVTMLAFHEGARRTFVGVLCATFTVVMYAAPLAVMKTVIQTKSVEYMPIFLIIALWINGCVWFAFALLLTDYYILVPNAVGILLGATQVLVYLIYKNSSSSKSTQTIKDEDSSDMVKEGINMQYLGEEV